jgi:hypothetical protein
MQRVDLAEGILNSKPYYSIKMMARKSSKRMNAILNGDDDAADTTLVDDDDSLDTLDPDSTLNDELGPFDWDSCSFDQVFVFNPEKSAFIIEILVNKLRPSRTSRQLTPKGANIIFLCLRYAHYYSSPEVLKDFFNLSIEQIVHAVQVINSF